MKFPIKGGESDITPQYYSLLSWQDRRALREAYIKKQGGNCYFCNEPLEKDPSIEVLKKKVNKDLFPDTFFKFPVHLHHCHETDLTIGAVHNYCNAVLWHYHGE